MKPETDVPAIAKIWKIMAVIPVVVGIILAYMYLPKPHEIYGIELSPDAEDYLLSVLWFVAGLVEAVLCLTVSKVIVYLHRIAENTAR